MKKPVLNIAHRGASGHAPENTLAAVQRAVELGADAVELDFHQTADGRLIALHDFSLKRTTGVPGMAGSLRLKEIKALDAGSWWDRTFRKERIPTLEEVLETCRNRILLHLELKMGSSLYPGIESRVVKTVNDLKVRDAVTVSSYDTEALRRVREADRRIPLGLLTRLKGPGPVLRLAESISARSLHVSTKRLTPRLLHETQDRGLRVYVYTVNGIRSMKHYIEMGVDGLFTNFPDRLAGLTGPSRSS
jgi:glycerophosphoryl diester phosphodiesterase